VSSKPRPLKLRTPPPCAPEVVELQFFEFVLLQCSLQAVFQASASEVAVFLRALQPVFFFPVALPGLPPSCARVAQA
jgi:hypothetical protein